MPGPDGLVAHKPASDVAVRLKCTGCVGAHEADNAACWAAVPDTAQPPVLSGSANQLFDFKTGQYMGTYTYTVVNSWPYVAVTTGRLTISR